MQRASATFALWDLDTGNLVGVYDSEPAALAVVRAAITAHGTACIDPLALVRETRRGRARTIAAGKALAQRAAGPAPPASPRRRVSA